MLTSAQIMTLLDGLDKPGVHGRTTSIRRANTPAFGNRESGLTANQSKLLNAIDAMPRPARTGRYVHPATAAAGVSKRADPLTAAQIAWLSGLPKDPAQTSHQDATEVFRLLAGSNFDDPQQRADKPLLRSIADPLRDFHDELQARADFAAAQAAPTPVPQDAIGALTDAILAENNQLTPAEAVGRADSTLREFSDRRLRDRQQRAAAAQRRIDEIAAARAERAQVTVTR
jgi:hypothetical protein